MPSMTIDATPATTEAPRTPTIAAPARAARHAAAPRAMPLAGAGLVAAAILSPAFPLHSESLAPAAATLGTSAPQSPDIAATTPAIPAEADYSAPQDSAALPAPPVATATSSPAAARITPFTGWAGNLGRSFVGWNGALQATGYAATPVIIWSGADARVHNAFSGHERDLVGGIGAAAGALVPVAAGGALWGWSHLRDAPEERVAAFAVMQSVALSYTYNNLLKALTGRPRPGEGDLAAEDTRRFRFGFLRGGTFWGWPSGHMMVNASMVATLQRLYPDKVAVQAGGGAYLAAMFWTVISLGGGRMHWFSDAVTGAFVGYAVGNSVGEGFAVRMGRAQGDARTASNGGVRLSLAPILATSPGAALVARF